MPPANEYGQYFVRWFDGLGLITQSIVLFGVFMLLRGLLLWMKSRRQLREAEAERAGPPDHECGAGSGRVTLRRPAER